MDNPDEEVEIGLGSGVTRTREYMAYVAAMKELMDAREWPKEENWYEEFIKLIVEDEPTHPPASDPADSCR
jgi:hypothetical protein